MTMKEFYDLIKGDYEDVLKRMRSEERVKKFVIMFLRDPSYQELMQAMEVSDVEAAFRAAHTLKGVYHNLAFAGQADSCVEITELLREKKLEEAGKLLPAVTKDYQSLVEEIKKIEESHI